MPKGIVGCRNGASGGVGPLIEKGFDFFGDGQVELILLSLPWLGIGLFMGLYVRNPPGLPPPFPPGEARLPSVSIVVPARNEEANIEACLSSLAASRYPEFEILVVDDRSLDRTRDIIERLSAASPSSVRLIEGQPLPEGWFGKPWACWQGAEASRGDLILFTDADTVHSPDLLGQAVRGLIQEEADAYTVIGRQVMLSFWEQLVQPQFFMLLASRFPRVGTPRRPDHWRHAIANGQYLLFTRESYEGLGGHEVVAGEVVEDLRIAQLLVRAGKKLVVRGGEGLETRMYRSLGGLIEGWSKNVATAALQSTVRWLLPVVLPLSLVVGVTLWLAPPGTLVWSLTTGERGSAFIWSAVTTGLSALIWVRASVLMKGNPIYGLLYPMGAILGGFIFLNSWWRGTRIEWKGRLYEMPQHSRTRPPPGPQSW